MSIRPFAKVGACAAALAVTISGLTVAPMAFADPVPATTNAQTVTGLGSDTTQDVMSAIANSINASKGGTTAYMASYDALGDTTVAVKGSNTIPRANGSGEGFKLLQLAYNQLGSSSSTIKSGSSATSLTAVNGTPASGQYDVSNLVDFARSSSNGSGANARGIWSYVPFAQDAVTLAVNPNSPVSKIPLVQGSSSDTASTPSIYAIYHCLAKYVYLNSDGSYNSVGATSSGPSGTTATEIKPILPKFGSGTRSYFVTTVAGYASNAANLGTDFACGTSSVGGSDVNEHDGSSVAALGDSAMVPFSIPQWVAQSKSSSTGVTDRRSGVVLMGLKASPSAAVTSPTTGSGDAIATNPNFLIKRTVFNVLPYGRVSNPSAREYELFNGANSLVCQSTDVIRQYGFIPLNNAATPASITDCGYVQNRFGADFVTSASASPITNMVSEFTQVAAGDSFSVAFTKTGTTAGVVNLFQSTDNYAAPVTSADQPFGVALGSTDGATGSFTVTVPADAPAGAYTVRASYAGDFSRTGLNTGITVQVVRPYTVTVNDIAYNQRPGTIALNATVTPATGAARVGGYLTVIDDQGNELGASVYIPRRTSAATTVSYTATAGYRNIAVRFEPDNSSAGLNGTSSFQDIFVSAGKVSPFRVGTAATIGSTISATNPIAPNGAGWAAQTGYVGKVRSVNSTAGNVQIRLTVPKALSTDPWPTGTVQVLLGTTKGGGIQIANATLVTAGGVTTITLPAPSTWRVAGTAQGVVRYLNVVYSGDATYNQVTVPLKVLVTN